MPDDGKCYCVHQDLFPNILTMIERRETGLQFSAKVLLFFLCVARTLAHFHFSSYFCCCAISTFGTVVGEVLPIGQHSLKVKKLQRLDL